MHLAQAKTKFLKHLKTVRALSPNTVRAYKQDLNQLQEDLTQTGVTETNQLNEENLRNWLWTGQRRGYAKSTLQRKLATIKTFTDWLERTGEITANPANNLRTPKNGKALPHVLTTTHIKTLIENAATHAETTKGPSKAVALRDHAILELLYASALRVNELCTLPLNGYNPEEQTVRVHGKGAKDRITPLGTPAAKALEKYLTHSRPQLAARNKNKTDNTLFLGSRGGTLNPAVVYRLVRTHTNKENSAVKTGPHTMRHSAATHMLDGGAELRVVQEYLGHANLQSTQLYTHLTTSGLQESYKRAHPRA